MPKARFPKVRKSQSEMDHILVKGASEHNLKNVSLEIPKRSLVVFTGVSGSGKSSLAFDTIFAEGQRRYVESLSAYARQFLGQLEKPKYETIRGLSPTIAIEQKAASKNPRSTVGTITEIYDYLRVLFARIGIQHCHKCGKEVGRGDASSMVNQIMGMADQKVLILAPVVDHRKGTHRELLDNLAQQGYARVRVDGVVHQIGDVQALAKHKKHRIEVVVDRLRIRAGKSDLKKRLTDSVETALRIGNGEIIVHALEGHDQRMSEQLSCCQFAFPKLEPPLFSFNSPQGMCLECNGLGTVVAMDENKVVPDKNLSIRDGAVLPWRSFFEGDGSDKDNSWGRSRVRAMEKQWRLNIDTPWKKLPAKLRQWIMHGAPESQRQLKLTWKGSKGGGSWTVEDEGLLHRLMRRYQQTQSDRQKVYYGKFMSTRPCLSCHGARLRAEVLGVRVDGRSITDLTKMTIGDLHTLFKSLKLSGTDKKIAQELLKEIVSRLSFLVNVGLGYLSLDRKGPTLSGGEAQRIRLASQIGSELTGVLYVLDEPSIGLHQRDNRKLLDTLCHLRDIGNTLIVVEHDQETIETADWVVDIGPGAGRLGGEVVAEGTPSQIRGQRKSLTGGYLSGRHGIRVPDQRRTPEKGGPWLTIEGANENNLQSVDFRLPLGVLACVTGVSGAGKSTLINQILYPALSVKLHQSDHAVGSHRKIAGLEHLDKVINIDQKPIGRTPRSNPATYTKVFDLIRDFFAQLPEARTRGYKKGRFSFNVKGGRCEKCQGDGSIKVEMHFLADVFVPCEVCQSQRFNESTLQIRYQGYSIADVLNLSVAEAEAVFKNHPAIARILGTLSRVGLDYIKLGQSATTMSGGEAQRIKLARELAKRDTGRTLYILDEPTTGLHFEDVKNLLGVLQDLVDQGNTVIVIEHNLDVIKTSDWVIDLGPGGGKDGGKIVAEGTPEKVARVKRSFTGQFLVDALS